jgi:hypothetical protein
VVVAAVLSCRCVFCEMRLYRDYTLVVLHYSLSLSDLIAQETDPKAAGVGNRRSARIQ